MNGPIWVDSLYEVFVDTLPSELRAPASRLAYSLALTPVEGTPWSEVFGHSVTLCAPALLAEAMPPVPSGLVRSAVLAHMLAVIDAFGTDRIEDGQVERAEPLLSVLQHVRGARNRSLARVLAEAQSKGLDYRRADQRTNAAIRAEREVLARRRRTDFATYEAISRGKQAIGLPASVALAAAAGLDARHQQGLQRLLLAICMGLQLHDDVADWEDDERRGGSWAVCLARGLERSALPSGAGAQPPSVRVEVLRSGVLALMLRRAERHFRAARRLCTTLGAKNLGVWASARERRLGELAAREQRSAGYTNRDRALRAWAREVLA